MAQALARTRNLSADSPVYNGISGGVTGILYDFILNPYSPKASGWKLTSDGIWRYTALDTAVPTIEHVLTHAMVQSGTGRGSSRFYFKLEASINIEGYIAVLVGTDGTGNDFNRLYCAYSLDAGDTWSYGLVDTTTGGRVHPNGGLALVPRVVGGDLRLFAGVYRSEQFVGENYFIYQSDDKGANWAQKIGLTYGGAPVGAVCAISPYHNNAAGNICWVSFSPGVDSIQIYKTTDAWSTFSTISLPSTTAADTASLVKRLGIEIWPQDHNQVAIWNRNNRLFKSTDGSTFTEVSYSGYVPATHGAVAAAGGFPHSGSQLYIMTANRYVFVSTDGGVNWVDKSGDVRDYITTNITAIDATYHAVVVPVWVAE